MRPTILFPCNIQTGQCLETDGSAVFAQDGRAGGGAGSEAGVDSGNCSWASRFLPSRGECPNGDGGDGIPLQMLAAIAHLAKATVCSMNCVSTNLIYT